MLLDKSDVGNKAGLKTPQESNASKLLKNNQKPEDEVLTKKRHGSQLENHDPVRMTDRASVESELLPSQKQQRQQASESD